MLVVEDDENIRRVTRFALLSDHYEVDEVETGRQALQQVIADVPDLILLDIDLPDMSGMDVILHLKDLHPSPVVVFSAGSGQDQIRNLIENGAADFVAKPFRTRELLSCVRSVLIGAWYFETNSPSQINLGPLEINLSRRQVCVNGHEQNLDPSEFVLLSILARHPGRLLTYNFIESELREMLPGNDDLPLISHIVGLRHKLEIDPLHPQILTSELGIGFRFRVDPIVGPMGLN